MAERLLIDLGNSLIKCGFGDGEGARRIRALDYHADFDAAMATLGHLIEKRQPESIVACNSGPQEVVDAIDALATGNRLATKWVTVSHTELGVRCAYPTLRNMAVDRWIAVLASFDKKRSALVADIGSVTSVDAVTSSAEHLGGMLLPGMAMMQDALFAHGVGATRSADQLEDPKGVMDFFASDIPESVQNGCLMAISGAIGNAFQILKRNDPDAKLILTGGGAAAVIRYLPARTEHRPALILDGLDRLASIG